MTTHTKVIYQNEQKGPIKRPRLKRQTGATNGCISVSVDLDCGLGWTSAALCVTHSAKAAAYAA